MIVDLHAHYAMHLYDAHYHYPCRCALRPRALFKSLLRIIRRPRRRRALFLRLFRFINVTGNYRTLTSGPSVTLERMKIGGVGVALSPVIDPLNEFGDIPIRLCAVFLALLAMIPFNYASLIFAVAGAGDLAVKLATIGLFMVGVLVMLVLAVIVFFRNELPKSPPRGGYFGDLLYQMDVVEKDVLPLSDWARVVRNNYELKETREAGKIAIIHCVEGGFQLGASVESIERHVALLAERGVAYVTLAHLFFRGIATVAPALPFLSDRRYHRLFHQPEQGLTPLGEAAVTAMFRNGVLIDVTHMSEQAIKQTLALLGRLEDEYRCPPVPVIASHIACRFGKYEYNLCDTTIEQIGNRNGVMGVIFCDHWMHDGPRKDDPRTRRRTFQIVKGNIDRIERVTKSNHRCAAIGSDLDGFVKPMLRGLEDMGCMRDLEIWLRTEYDSKFTELILNGNALRVLESTWGHCKLKDRAHSLPTSAIES